VKVAKRKIASLDRFHFHPTHLIVFLRLLIKLGAKIGTHLSKLGRPVKSQYISFMLLETHVPAGTKYSSQISWSKPSTSKYMSIFGYSGRCSGYLYFFISKVLVNILVNIEKKKHEKIYIWFRSGRFRPKPTWTAIASGEEKDIY